MENPRLLVCLLITLAVGCSGDSKPSFSGKYAGGGLKLELRGTGSELTGSIEKAGRTFPLEARIDRGQLRGSFDAEGESFPVSARFDGDTLAFETGGNAFSLVRQGGTNPLAPAPAANPLASTSGAPPIAEAAAATRAPAVLEVDSASRPVATPPVATTPVAPTPVAAASAPGTRVAQATGLSVEVPAGWSHQDSGEALVLTPGDARTNAQGPLEAFLALGVPTDGVSDLSHADVQQGAVEVFQAVAPFARMNGSGEIRTIGGRPTRCFEAAGRSPTGLDVTVRLWVSILGDRAAVVVGLGETSQLPSRMPALEGIMASARFEAPKGDPRLVGVWRKTDTYISGSFSSVTQTDLVLRSDGTCTRGSKLSASDYGYDSAGNLDSSTSAMSGGGEGAHGRWSSEGRTLRIDIGGVETYDLYLEGDSLMLTAGGKRKVWSRVR